MDTTIQAYHCPTCNQSFTTADEVITHVSSGVHNKPTQDIQPTTPQATETPVLTNPVGRPSKYKPEFCDKIIGHMGQGYSMESFGGIIEVGKNTLYEWCKEHEDFRDAVEIGRQKSLVFWETIGINGTVGKPNYYKDKITGKEMPTDKFNSQTYALHMANKHKWISNKTDVVSDGEKIAAPSIILSTIDPREKKEVTE